MQQEDVFNAQEANYSRSFPFKALPVVFIVPKRVKGLIISINGVLIPWITSVISKKKF